MNEDPLNPARGLGLGCVVAAFLWAVVWIVALFFAPGPW